MLPSTPRKPLLLVVLAIIVLQNIFRETSILESILESANNALLPPLEYISPSRPRILIAGGCVGSTAALSFTREILNHHAVEVFGLNYETFLE